MANSVDPDQTTPFAYAILSETFSVQNVRMFTIDELQVSRIF